MNRIHCHIEKEKIQVDFTDYKNERQLKDFYKLFKKASGYLVLEYEESPEIIVVRTNNSSNSVSIIWNQGLGCGVIANSNDAKALVEIVFKMICYRYREYSEYGMMLRDIIKVDEGNEIIEGSRSGERKNDNDIVEDIKGLISLVP